MAERIVKRSGDIAKRKESSQIVAEIGFARSSYRTSRSKVDSLADAWEAERARTDKARIALDGLIEQLSAAQEVIDSDYLPEGAQPPARIAKRDKLQIEVSFLEAALEAQLRSTNKVFEELNEAEKKLFEADRNLHQFVDKLEVSEIVTEVQAELDKDRTARLAKLEKQRALRWESEQKQAIDARAAQIQELTNIASKQLGVAAVANKAAKQRVRETSKQQKEVVKKLEVARETHLADRLEAILELKTNQNAARAEVATQAEKHVRKLKAGQDQLEREKAAMLAKGLNPYTEFRKKEFAAEAKSREKKMKDAVEHNKALLAERLIKEEESRRVEEAAELKAKEYEKKHRDEQGRHVIEERNQLYITSVTTGGREVLDPTGRASRVDPSQVTDVADLSFGLGKSQRIPADAMARITEKIRQKLKVDRDDLGEYQHLIKGLLGEEAVAKSKTKADSGLEGTAASSSSAARKVQLEEEAAAEKRIAELKLLAQRDGPMPGVTLAAVTVNLSSDEDAKEELLRIAEEEAGGEISLGASLDDSRARYQIRDPSQFEKDSFARAKQRQRDRLLQGTEQVAGGRTFHGQAFVPKPAEVIYKDFDVGQTYTKTFTLTNASYTFNSFKILDLEDAYMDFFTIKFERPGRMSAGVSCPLTITFSPQARQDIFTTIKFLTETGPVEVPLKCLIKRCAPRVITTEIDFGDMTIGQKANQQLKINNTQALSTAIVVSRVEPVAQEGDEVSPRATSPRVEVAAAPELELEIEEKTDQSAGSDAELAARVKRVTTEVFRRKQRENPTPISLVSSEGFVDGYGATALTVVCAPLAVGNIEQVFSVIFAAVRDSDRSINDLGEPALREQSLTVRVKGGKAPIFLDDESVDLRTCLHGRIYRKRLEVRNRAKTAYRVNVKLPALFKGIVEVSPDILFVQGRGSQFLNIKFSPTAEMLAKIGHFTFLRDTFLDAALVALPIELEVVNQDLPVYFVVRSEVTSSTIELSTKRLDFGQVYVGQSSTMPVTLTNTSMLPQKIAFVRLKREVSVQPNDGFAVLLPNESYIFQVSFSPYSVAAYEFDLALMTSCNDRYFLKMCAQGVEAPIELSSAIIHMRTTGPGQRVLSSVSMKNTTSRQQTVEIMIPDTRFTWLKISPTTIDLPPLQSARIELEYTPPDDCLALDPGPWHEGVVAAVTAENVQSANGDATESVSPFQEWKEEAGWVFAKGMYGEVQWVKEGAGIPPVPVPSAEAPNVPESENGDGMGEMKEPDAANDGPCDLPREEWGIAAKWNVPICIRPLNQAASSTGKLRSGALSADSTAFPLFMCVHTMVTLPQLEADPKVLDFGQLAVGTRELRTIKLINRGIDSVQLQFDGINAVGPFMMIRPPKLLGPGEIRTIVIECLPTQPGLVIEMLELTKPEEVGGHQLRIPLRAQGLKPSIELQGLAPAPRTWDARSGLLDLGSVVPADKTTKTFTIINRSTFAVDVNVIRAAGKGLSPAARAQLVERTATGAPIISYRPERCNIPQGGSAVITVTFDPDRGRFQPFREDLNVIVGQTDEILQVGICGRCWPRQCFVIPANPVDEPFYLVDKPGGSGVPPMEDLLRTHGSTEVRKAVANSCAVLQVDLPPEPPLTLEFPDPFASDADPSSYAEVGGAGAAAAPAKGKAAPSSAAAGARSQQKRFLVCCAKVADNRAGNGNCTFEIVMSQPAKESGLWTLSADKGAANAGQDVPIDVTCTLNKPRGVGGLSVGSWEVFKADVIIKGGWAAPGEPAESKVPLLLKCFVSL